MTHSDRDISKFLSLVLRHAPTEIGITLDAGGWANVADLIDKARMELTIADIARIVANSDKQRFALSHDGSLIRAQQGHSIQVDLGLTPQTPPAILFHGTVEKFLGSILAQGLKPMGRHHVHLSTDSPTARQVALRRGPPIILQIDAAGMAEEQIPFFVSGNGVWLTSHVPAKFIQTL
jgi:putative RNA 2'-phosphotransferase